MSRYKETQGDRRWWDSAGGSERLKASPEQSTRKWWLRGITPAGLARLLYPRSQAPSQISTYLLLIRSARTNIRTHKETGPVRFQAPEIRKDEKGRGLRWGLRSHTRSSSPNQCSGCSLSAQGGEGTTGVLKLLLLCSRSSRLFRGTGQVKVVRQGHERALGRHGVSQGCALFSLGMWQLLHR